MTAVQLPEVPAPYDRELFRLRCQADRLETMYGMWGAAENIREAADKIQAALTANPPETNSDRS